MQLSDTNIEDIEDLLPAIEDSFGFKFEPLELEKARTLGDLCDIVANKVQHFDHIEDCTTQQAFYKLRDSISSTLQLDKSVITTNTELLKLFPKRLRRTAIRKIEKQLFFKLDILRPKNFVTISLVGILLISFVGLFFIWKLAICGILFFFFGMRIAHYFANTLDLKTIGEVADKMSRESYLKSRRNPSSVNKNEIENKIRDIFRDRLSIPESALHKDASFT
jgi:acyl carrier protein